MQRLIVKYDIHRQKAELYVIERMKVLYHFSYLPNIMVLRMIELKCVESLGYNLHIQPLKDANSKVDFGKCAYYNLKTPYTLLDSYLEGKGVEIQTIKYLSLWQWELLEGIKQTGLIDIRDLFNCLAIKEVMERVLESVDSLSNRVAFCSVRSDQRSSYEDWEQKEGDWDEEIEDCQKSIDELLEIYENLESWEGVISHKNESKPTDS